MEYPKFKVTVSCMTYNQSKYITDAMNGFTMQQTDFPFVCTIVDDASTDGEQQVIKQYVEEMPEFVFRMKVKAGLAGYAQVYGKYNTTPYDKLKLDLSYIENYSVWLDLKLMLLTLKILIKPESTEGVDNTQVTAMKSLKAGEPIENENRNE